MKDKKEVLKKLNETQDKMVLGLEKGQEKLERKVGKFTKSLLLATPITLIFAAVKAPSVLVVFLLVSAVSALIIYLSDKADEQEELEEKVLDEPKVVKAVTKKKTAKKVSKKVQK